MEDAISLMYTGVRLQAVNVGPVGGIFRLTNRLSHSDGVSQPGLDSKLDAATRVGGCG